MILNIIASVFSGLIGAMGFGGGGILILFLTLLRDMDQKAAQGINLMFFIPCAITGLIFHSHNGLVNIKRTLPYLVSAIPGVFVGLYLTKIISDGFLGKAFGIVMIILGAFSLFGEKIFNKTK